MLSLHPTKAGFTLIELLVVTTVAVLMLSTSVVAFNTLSRRQVTFASAQEVLSVIKSAQARARSGDKPTSGCTTLNGYRVWATAGQSVYRLGTMCNGSATPVETVTYNLKNTERFVQTFSLTFPVLPGSAAAQNQTISITQITSTNNLPRFEFVVTPQGVIEEGQYIRQ